MNCYDLVNQLTPKDIIELMTKLGADRYKETKDAILFPTICHNIDSDEASLKLYYYKDTHLFYCYTEDGPMSIFRFMEQYYETRQMEYDWFEDIYSVLFSMSSINIANRVDNNFQNLREKFEKRQAQVLPEFSPGVLDVFVKNYPIEWLKDGISKEAMDKFGILYSISQNKIVIPHYDINNRLIGIRGRALNDWEVDNFGKYMPMKIEKTWYSHPLSLNLYGLNLTKENIKKYGICYLFESEKAVLQLEGFSIPNCGAAVCGSNFNKYQLDILLKECSPREIIICFDNEELPNKDDYFRKLKATAERYSNYCNFSFIYDKNKLLELKDSPTDKGEEIFKELLQRRVRIR
jgi:hypothetical protein